MSYVASSRSVPLGIPIHRNAGLSRGLGSLGAGPLPFLTDLAGGLFGSIFGNKAKSNELKQQRQMALDQLNANTLIASMEKELGLKQVDAAVLTERIRAQNELAALDTAYSAELSSQRTKKRLASDALSAQLIAQTQGGIFNLAQAGMEQSTSLATQYPRSATTTLVLLVLGTAAAVAFMRNPGKGSRKRRRRKGGGGRREAPSFDSSPSPSMGLTMGASS